jgi:phosphoribosylanthranilate isomerase
MSPPVKVKVCGVTRLQDALLAARLGADRVGFNFWPRSRRYLAPADAAALVAALPAGVLPVGVFVDPTPEELLAAIRASGVRAVQLHGDEPPALCRAVDLPVVKAIRVKDASSLAALGAYRVEAFLLDSASSGYGGSGAAFDWSLAAGAAACAPVWLAGGLTPANVAEAVARVRPLGVDVASGVETSPGVKDEGLMEAFIRNARSVS